MTSNILPKHELRVPDVNDIKEKLEMLSRDCPNETNFEEDVNPYLMLPHTSVVVNRPNLTWNFPETALPVLQPLNVAAIPLKSQEKIVLSELISCLVGISGQFIVGIRKAGVVEFKVSEQISESIRTVVGQILPLAKHFCAVQHFIHEQASRESGQILRAIGAGMNDFMSEYFISIASLEADDLNNRLTLQKLLFLIQPKMNGMMVLADVSKKLEESGVNGGKALCLLHKTILTMAGDSVSRRILTTLTQKASVPYMEILHKWILRGMIIDPYKEFLIQDNEVREREEVPEDYSSDYWEKRYTIRFDSVPEFLEKYAEIILSTGKYLNVIRQCGKRITSPLVQTKIKFLSADENYLSVIENSHRFASQTLLEVLLKENDLMGHLQSVKRYFLLQQGDFIMQFMDATEQELSKKIDVVQPMRLENLLQLTLRLSSAKNDPYKDDLSIEFLPYCLTTQLSKICESELDYWNTGEREELQGLECFAFVYNVRWPISLVLNHISISKYQMLFRQLFICKHVERQLCKVWKSNSNAKKFNPEAAELYRSAFTLRQRMMNAVQNIGYYMMIEVVEPNWHAFLEKMKTVENVDEVLNVHSDFIDSCLKNCMLTDANLLRNMTKLFKVCSKFCEFIQRAQKYFLDAELTSMVCDSDELSDEDEDTRDKSLKDESAMEPSDSFSENVNRFNLEFTGMLIGLLQRINDRTFNNSDKFINLANRLNYNSFYNHQMESLCAKDSMRVASNSTNATHHHGHGAGDRRVTTTKP